MLICENIWWNVGASKPHLATTTNILGSCGTNRKKGQYETNAFTTTYNYLVFATKILPFSISVTSY
jgi:hypothetical protein